MTSWGSIPFVYLYFVYIVSSQSVLYSIVPLCAYMRHYCLQLVYSSAACMHKRLMNAKFLLSRFHNDIYAFPLSLSFNLVPPCVARFCVKMYNC